MYICVLKSGRAYIRRVMIIDIKKNSPLVQKRRDLRVVREDIAEANAGAHGRINVEDLLKQAGRACNAGKKSNWSSI